MWQQMLSDKRRIARENRAIEIKERAEHYRSIREYNKALHDARALRQCYVLIVVLPILVGWFADHGPLYGIRFRV